MSSFIRVDPRFAHGSYVERSCKRASVFLDVVEVWLQAAAAEVDYWSSVNYLYQEFDTLFLCVVAAIIIYVTEEVIVRIDIVFPWPVNCGDCLRAHFIDLGKIT